ncbi:MAG: hypothetical protein U1C66_00720, partial [Patescibacteria group bacterium]|nr:hypothetical protein [Patescibacteria group bacterium]
SVKQYFAKTDALEVEVSELRFELEALKALVGPSADIAAPDVDGPSETPEATPEEPPPADESEEVVEPTPEVEKNAAEESPAPEPIVEETSTDSASSPEPEIAPETASAEE